MCDGVGGEDDKISLTESCVYSQVLLVFLGLDWQQGNERLGKVDLYESGVQSSLQANLTWFLCSRRHGQTTEQFSGGHGPQRLYTTGCSASSYLVTVCLRVLCVCCVPACACVCATSSHQCMLRVSCLTLL